MKKKITIMILFGLALASCHSGASDQKQEDTAQYVNSNTVKKDTLTVPAEQVAGKSDQLLASSDCLSCHKPDVKLVGPSFHDIADKYKGQATAIDRLTAKVIKGGSGVWGEAMMNPHPALKETEVREMVKYILSSNRN